MRVYTRNVKGLVEIVETTREKTGYVTSPDTRDAFLADKIGAEITQRIARLPSIAHQEKALENVKQDTPPDSHQPTSTKARAIQGVKRRAWAALAGSGAPECSPCEHRQPLRSNRG